MDKFVYVKILEKPLDKNQKPYVKITDQEGQVFNIFGAQMNYEVGKCYLFTYTLNDKGYPNIERAVPLVNIFKQEALKEIANKNDVIKHYSIAITQSIQVMAAGGHSSFTSDELFAWADDIYKHVNDKADEAMAQIQNVPSPKFEKS